MEYYIELQMTEMIMCKSIRFTYYCEELFVVKHKSAYGCGSAIFYDMGPKRVTQSCEFKYMYDAKVTPTILDGGNELLQNGKLSWTQITEIVIQKIVG